MLLASPASVKPADAKNNGEAFVVLDSGIDYLPFLVSSLPNADVLVLDPKQDGIEQITAALSARSAVSSIHIVSHGKTGQLFLGNSQVSFNNLSRYADHLRAWADVVSGKDILLYGCQVAKGAIGYLFLQQLHQLTGANIAASTERVGRVGRHTHWMLDVQMGDIATPLVFSEFVQANYPSNFETVNFSISPNTLIESEGTTFRFDFSVDGDIPAGGSVVRIRADRPQAINQWNLFAIQFPGLAGIPEDVSPNLDFSEFEVTIVEPTASIIIPVFNDGDPEGEDEYTWTATAQSAGTSVNIEGNTTSTIFDTPDQVPQPEPEPEPEPDPEP